MSEQNDAEVEAVARTLAKNAAFDFDKASARARDNWRGEARAVIAALDQARAKER